MMRKSKGLAFVLLIVTSACAPRVQVTPLGRTFPPRSPAQELAVFSTQTPSCPYEELAILTAYRGTLGEASRMEEVLAAIKERARTLGADAIVALRQVSEGGQVPRDGYSGTAIRFTDPTCR